MGEEIDPKAGNDLQISDRTVLDLEGKVLRRGVSEASDALDLSVDATDVLGPFVDGFLPGNGDTESMPGNGDCTGCGDLCRGPYYEDMDYGSGDPRSEDVSFVTREALEDSDVEEDATAGSRNRATCSRSSTFSERSMESCDSFKSAASRLEPDTEREELHRMFDAFDENGDGKISQEELGNTMRKLGFDMSASELVTMVAVVDKDGDGCVNFDEFLSLYSTLYYDEQSKPRFDGEDEEELLEAFSVFDKNNDGYISVVELQAVLSSLGVKEGTKLADCQKMIKAVDVDGDGQVNFSEFKHMMSSGLFKQG